MNYRLIQMEKGKELQRQLKGKTNVSIPPSFKIGDH